MTERTPDDVADDQPLDQPPGPAPDEEHEVPAEGEPDLGDFEGNLNA